MEQRQAGEIALCFSKGEIKGSVPGEPPLEAVIPLHHDAGAKEEVLARFAADAQALYGLLQGKLPEWLAPLSLSVMDEEADAGCSCEGTACSHAAAVLAAAREQLAAEPLLHLVLLGLPREALLAGVFAAWAQASAPAAGSEAAGSAAAPKEKAPAGPSPGEWLAEAAGEGRLHRPGQLLAEVEVGVKSPPPPEALRPAGDWAGLLPGARAEEALTLVLRHAAERRRPGAR